MQLTTLMNGFEWLGTDFARKANDCTSLAVTTLALIMLFSIRYCQYCMASPYYYRTNYSIHILCYSTSRSPSNTLIVFISLLWLLVATLSLIFSHKCTPLIMNLWLTSFCLLCPCSDFRFVMIVDSNYLLIRPFWPVSSHNSHFISTFVA